MQRSRRLLSVLLLTVFCVAVLPAPVLHDLFADHVDQEENHCRFFHKDLGTHVEQKESHCDFFKTLTPLYDIVSIQPDLNAYANLVLTQPVAEENSLPLSATLILPARAPPVA